MCNILQSRVFSTLFGIIRDQSIKQAMELDRIRKRKKQGREKLNDLAGYCSCVKGLLRFTFATSITTTRLTGMVREDGLDQMVGSLFELVNDSVVQGILVLFQPSGDVVRHLHENKRGRKTELSTTNATRFEALQFRRSGRWRSEPPLGRAWRAWA